MPATTPTDLVWNQILVPLDLSDCSQEALRRAAAIARSQPGTCLTLLAVIEPAHVGLRIQTNHLHDQMKHDTEVTLKKWLAQEAGDLVPAAKTLILEGAPGSVICDEAERHGYDLIVVGSHGRTGIKRYLLGSVAERVVRHAPCEVLVVR